MVSTKVNISGYRITEELYNGSRTIVYRGYREINSLPVVIKLLKNPYPSFNELLSFRNQYTIAKNLNSPLIVQTYSLEPYQNGYALVMEDFGGISLKQWMGRWENGEMGRKQQTLREFLEIAITICNILDILYRERIIHKDIKPSNILINPETKEVKLIDFSIASLLPKETQTLINPHGLEGTLAYISPEQTGRMNRGIDYRTDFYSLGVTFYELLTGELPFQLNDPMELVHSHIAKQPPSVIRENIPQVLSDIVMKLMAKNAEDRYQSALGLKFDLEKCLHQLTETSEIQSFAIASRDVCDRFTIPEKLYGRENEVQALLSAFDRIATPLGKGGQREGELMLVAGFSGIGKTAVVNEVHKPIVRQHGYFIKGKYDQFQRNIPFSAFVQAFRDLMGQLLSESDVQIQQWRNKILKAIGENGQVLIDIIPELEEIIGKQPSVIELTASAAQNRFNLLFVKFIEVLATPEHPLVMFLDDLQWADSASLSLMKLLMSQAEGGYLFIIGAYRDNEVFLAHPLMLALEEIEKTKAIVNTIALTPLSQSDVNLMIADTFSCAIERAMLLTELVYQKAKGNPFFTTQFLKALYEDGLITFDWKTGSWQCDVAQVRSLALTDDVVEFMAVQLQKLPTATQNILKLAACIGNQFDLATLAIVSEQSEIETATVLWKALQEGLILPQSEIYKFYQNLELDTQHSTPNNQQCYYKFLHDRVQQASYSLIPQEQKPAVHLNIGQLLWQQTPDKELGDKLFDIVNQLNIGAGLIAEAERREELAQLNFRAGKKAKTSTAYEAAITNFSKGLTLLPANSWQTHYSLTRDLTIGLAEAEYLNINLDRAEELIGIVLQQSKTLLEQIPAYKLQIRLELARYRVDRSLEKGLQVLEQLGVPVDEHSEALSQLPDFADIESLSIAQDAHYLAAMDIAAHIYAAAVLTNPRIYELLVKRTVALAGEFGQSPTSAYAYANYGMLQSGLGNLEVGYQAGLLAIGILDQFADKILKCKVYAVFNAFIRIWNEPIEKTLDPLSEAIQSGLETGDYEYAGYCMAHRIENLLCMGTSLELLLETLEKYVELATRIEQPYTLLMLRSWQQVVLNLSGQAADPRRLVGKHYDEKSEIEKAKAQGLDLILLILSTGKIAVLYFFGAYDEAVACGKKASPCQHTVHVKLYESAFVFYYALALLANCPQTETERQDYLDRVAEQQKRLRIWADHFPPSFQHKCDLIEAEKARIEGNYLQAIDQYDRAILGAKENSFIQDEALANELAAKFYLDWGKEKFAVIYMQEAYYGYARWGAKAKVADLERRYPQLLASILQQTPTALSVNETVFALGTATSTISSSSSSSVSDSLDLAAILKASQTLSGEIELEKLLSSLLVIVIENAGANKCVLMLWRDERLLIKGSIIEGAEPIVLQRLPVEESEDIPLKLIYKVKHSRQNTVLLDATADPTLANDPYIVRQQPKSILCSPIIHQGKLLGILYLENNLATGAFTSDRVKLLNLICAQAAISLENARLYERSRDYAQQLEKSFAELSASNSRFEKLVDNVPGVVYQARKTADGIRDITYISADCYDLLELTPEQVIDNMQFLMEMIHPDEAASYQQCITDSIQTLSPLDWSGQIITPSGIVKWVHVESRIQKLADETLVWDGLIFDISDYKRAEKSLRLTQFAIDRSSLPVWWVKSSGEISYVNDAACRDLGYSRSEILQKHVWDFTEFSPEDWPDHWQELKEQSSIILETYNFNKAGHRYPVEVTINYFELDGEEYNCSFVKNISDRRRIEAERQQTEAALHASQQRLSLLIQQTPMAVIEWNPEFRVQSWNPAAEKIFGYTAAEAMGRSVDFLIADETVKLQVDEIVADLLAQTGGNRSINENITKAGEIICCDWYNNPLVNEDGDLICIATIAIDITDLKQAEKQLQESQQLLELILDTIPYNVFWKDCNLIYQGSNRSFAEVVGFSSSTEIVGKSDYDLSWTTEESDSFRQFDRRVIEANKPELWIVETTLQADGTTIWIETSKLPLHDATGTVIGILGIYRDISDRKQAEALIIQKSQDLEKALKDLQQAQIQMIQSEKMSALGNLVAGVAHEINNPIGFIAGNLSEVNQGLQDLIDYVHLYQEKVPEPGVEVIKKAEEIDLDYLIEDLPKMLESMQTGCDRIKFISKSLRNFSRADSDRQQLFDLHEGIDSTVMILRHRLKANDNRPAIEVITNYGDIPPINCFPGQLNQVFMNILANAIDALEESNHGRSYGEITANPNIITITTSVENNRVKITITDNGNGMSEEVKAKIFDHLFTTKGVGKGTGLGLAIARQIVVERHAGSLEVESQIGQGTEFLISLLIKGN